MWTRKDTKVELSVMRGGVSCSAGSHKSWWMVPTNHSLESLLGEIPKNGSNHIFRTNVGRHLVFLLLQETSR